MKLHPVALFGLRMASWWTSADPLDSLDLDDSSIMSRVIQAVGLFGDILSLEDAMEPMMSEVRGQTLVQQEDKGETGEQQHWKEKEGTDDGLIDEEKEEMCGEKEIETENKEGKREDGIWEEEDKKVKEVEDEGERGEEEQENLEDGQEEEDRRIGKEGRSDEEEEKLKDDNKEVLKEVGWTDEVETEDDKERQDGDEVNRKNERRQTEEEEEKDVSERGRNRVETEKEDEERKTTEEEEDKDGEKEEKREDDKERRKEGNDEREKDREEQREEEKDGEMERREEEMKGNIKDDCVEKEREEEKEEDRQTNGGTEEEDEERSDGEVEGKEETEREEEKELKEQPTDQINRSAPSSPLQDGAIGGEEDSGAARDHRSGYKGEEQEEEEEEEEEEEVSASSAQSGTDSQLISAHGRLLSSTQSGSGGSAAHSGPQASGCRPEKRQEDEDLSPTQNWSRTEMEAKEDGDESRPEVNGELEKKNGSRQSSMYKTVSYRRIRKGNTKQRIDEFEAMTNS